MDYRNFFVGHPLTWEWPIFRLINNGFKMKYAVSAFGGTVEIDAPRLAEVIGFYVIGLLGFLLGYLILPIDLPAGAGFSLFASTYFIGSLAGFLYLSMGEEKVDTFDLPFVLEVELENGEIEYIVFNLIDLGLETLQAAAFGGLLWCFVVMLI